MSDSAITQDQPRSQPRGRKLRYALAFTVLALTSAAGFLVWQNFDHLPQQVQPTAVVEPAAELPVETALALAGPELIEPVQADALFAALLPELPIVETPPEKSPPQTVAGAELTREQIYAVTQALITSAFADARFTETFATAWSKRTRARPSGEFVFPANFNGDLLGPTEQLDGLVDYQLWGAGLRDNASPQAHDVWYMVLWNYDRQKHQASLESLFIAGKEIVHDWRPFSKKRISVEVR